MCVVLYVGCDSKHQKHFLSFFDFNEIRYKAKKCIFGCKIECFTSEQDIITLAEYITAFIVEFYLKEQILSKIYDEYSQLSVDDACNCVGKIINELKKSDIQVRIVDFLITKKSLHIESYILFNIKSIMLTTFEITDTVCSSLIFEKEREDFLSILRTYASLYDERLQKADVEFTSELIARVTLDNRETVEIENCELLPFLTSCAPRNVCVKGRAFSPFLYDTITKLFVPDTKKDGDS